MRAKAAFLTREAGIQFTNPVLSVGNPGRHMACPGVFCFCGGGRGGRRRFRGWFGVACRWRGLVCQRPSRGLRSWRGVAMRGPGESPLGLPGKLCIFFTRGFVHGG